MGDKRTAAEIAEDFRRGARASARAEAVAKAVGAKKLADEYKRSAAAQRAAADRAAKKGR